MTGKTQDTGFRHPEAVAYLQSLTDEVAAKHSPIVRESGGVVTRQRREGGEVRCREVGPGEASAGRVSDFAARLDRFGTRNSLFEAKELVELSDGAVWILKVYEKVFAGRDAACLGLFHALEYVAAADRDLPPSEGGRTARMDRFKERLTAGQVAQVIAELKPHRRRSEAVAACIDYFEANKDRMRCDLCRKRGLPVGSGVAESACKQIVGSRFKRAGCRWSKAGANALLNVKCCIENNRWADFLDWRNRRVAAA